MDSADLFAASWTVSVGIAEVAPRRCVQTDGQISAHFLLRTCWIQFEAVHASGMTPVKEALLPCVRCQRTDLRHSAHRRGHGLYGSAPYDLIPNFVIPGEPVTAQSFGSAPKDGAVIRQPLANTFTLCTQEIRTAVHSARHISHTEGEPSSTFHLDRRVQRPRSCDRIGSR